MRDTGHCIEKGIQVMHALRDLAEAAADETLSANTLRKKVNGLVWIAAQNMTKVMSNVSDTDHLTDEGGKLLEPGVDGFEELQVKYGWLHREQTHRFIVSSKARRLYELSHGTRAESRTLMHEILMTIPDSVSLFAPLRERLETVTQGDRDWPAVQSWCASHLAGFKAFS